MIFNRNQSLLLFLFCLITVLSGCAVVKPTGNEIASPTLWQAHHKQIAQVNHWAFQAQASLSYEGKQEAFILRWNCSINEQRSEFSLYTRQGHQLLHLNVFPNHAIIKDRKGKTTQHKNSGVLIRRFIGFDIPIDYLCHWTAGIPKPSKQSRGLLVVGKTGYLENLQQADWEIKYLSYKEHLVGQTSLALPKTMIAKHKKIEIRLSITRQNEVNLQAL
ncbi:MAG: lipoprotein insertase outer membrane protein LolB [Candidatus Oxydemutatoraceae bacterium WSBS_2016_MAG_OTU14]